MYCGNCGKLNNDNAVYCKFCGSKIVTDSTSEASQENVEDKKKYGNNLNETMENQNSEDSHYNGNMNNNIPNGRSSCSEYYSNSQHIAHDFESGKAQNDNGARGADVHLNSEPNDGYDKVMHDDKKKSSTATIIVALISFLAVVLIALAIAAIFIFNSGKSSGNINFNFPQNDTSSVLTPTSTTTSPVNDEIYIPAVTGFSYSNAIAKLNEKNLKSRVTAEYSAGVPENCIIRQSPQAGEKASEQDIVTIVISKGVYSTPDYDYYDIPYSARNESGYIFSQSNSRYLTKNDISGLSDNALQMGINEIYARHNVRFGAAGVKKYFNSKSWYVSYIDLDDFSDSVFNKYESANIEFLKNSQKDSNNSSSKSSSNSDDSQIMYFVRRAWSDPKSQKGAFLSLENAKKCADENPGYSVYDKSGKAVYTSSNHSTNHNSSSNGDDYVPIFTEIEASSELVSSKGTVYKAQNVCYDNDDCWAEGVDGTGKGEWIMYTAKKEQKVKGVEIINGFAKSANLYNQNGKIKTVRFEFSDGSSYTADLTVHSNATSDNYRTYDYIELPYTVSTTYIKIVIVDAVKGSKYDDTCITMIAPH